MTMPTPAPLTSANGKPPWPGDDNAHVFGVILGFTPAEISKQVQNGAIR